VPWSSGKYLSVPKYTQPYKYNGKEYIEMNDYDVYEYGFRGYYATIGRFTQIDPAAEGTYSKSPYAYASNGFVGEIDFMGLYGATGFTNKGNEYDTGYEEFVTIGTGGSDIGGLKSRFGNNFGIFDPALLVYNLTYINDDGEFISHINSSDKRIIVIHKDGTQDHVGYEMNAVDYSKYKEGDRVKGWYFNQITISITATAGFQFSFIPQLGVNAISWDILNFSWTFGKNGFSYDGDTWFGGENAIISQGISVGYYLQAGIVGQQFEAPGNNYQAKNQQLTGLSSLFHMLSTAGKWTDGDFNFNISLSAPIFASVTATISGNIYYQYWKH
jgi:RHS repeat-associated protein